MTRDERRRETTRYQRLAQYKEKTRRALFRSVVQANAVKADADDNFIGTVLSISSSEDDIEDSQEGGYANMVRQKDKFSYQVLHRYATQQAQKEKGLRYERELNNIISIYNQFFTIRFDPFLEEDRKRLDKMDRMVAKLKAFCQYNQWNKEEMTREKARKRQRAFFQVILRFAELHNIPKQISRVDKEAKDAGIYGVFDLKPNDHITKQRDACQTPISSINELSDDCISAGSETLRGFYKQDTEEEGDNSVSPSRRASRAKRKHKQMQFAQSKYKSMVLRPEELKGIL